MLDTLFFPGEITLFLSSSHFVEGYHIENSYPLHHLRSTAYNEAAVLDKMDGKLPPPPLFKDADAEKRLGGGGGR